MSTLPRIVIDDHFLCARSSSNNCFTFDGKLPAADATALDQTTTQVESDSWSVRFSGTAINVIGLTNCETPPCAFDLQVDGGPVTRASSSSFTNILQLTAAQLGNQTLNHTLTVSNSSDTSLIIDCAIVDAPLDTPLQGNSAGQLWADINNTAIAYHGAWNKVFDPGSEDEIMQTNTVGDSFSFDFIGDSELITSNRTILTPALGDSVVVIGVTVQGSVSLNVTIDNGARQGFIGNPHVSPNPFFIYYDSNSSLAHAQHHIEVTVTEQQFFEFRGIFGLNDILAEYLGSFAEYFGSSAEYLGSFDNILVAQFPQPLI
ncbi:hypothetical protein C8R46DRAFT_1040968 [Mycena filopes]|nr:hypothetical protein C8R46DRAFT_1040968 [Mycena filopes]